MSRRLLVLDSTPSTNSWLKENPGFCRPFASVRAIQQTAGRGRLTRSWHSGADGLDLTFSMVVPADRAAASALTIATGMALHQVLSRYADVKIKWPNDILLQGKKIAGILCEDSGINAHWFIVGIGVNINSRDFPPDLADYIQSLQLATGQEHDVQKLWIAIYREVVRAFRQPFYPFSAKFIQGFNNCAYRFVRREEIADYPLEFKTLLPDGRAALEDREGKRITIY